MILLSCATISRTSRYDNIVVQTCLKNIMCLSGSYALLYIWIFIVLCCLVFLPSMTFAWVKLLLYCFSVCLSVLFPGLYQDFNNIFLFSYFIVSISHYDTELCKNDIAMYELNTTFDHTSSTRDNLMISLSVWHLAVFLPRMHICQLRGRDNYTQDSSFSREKEELS